MVGGGGAPGAAGAIVIPVSSKNYYTLNESNN